MNPDDAVTDDNLAASARFARALAERTGAVIAITGAIDIVADGSRAFAVRNGSPLMGRITGAGCMLTCIVGAYAASRPSELLAAATAAVAAMGIAGECAHERMGALDGNESFRMYSIDALYNSKF